MKRLSIVMPFLNEGEEPARTIDSMYATCDPDFLDIIAIDDGSTGPFTDLSAFPEIRWVQHRERMGAANCLEEGVRLAETPNILIIDAHMRFRNDRWAERIVQALEAQPKTLFCTTCVALRADQMDLNKATKKYHGANIILEDPEQWDSPIAAQILEPKWRPEQPGQRYEIPCILGANYAVRKDWFQHIRGVQGLQKWGGAELYLSLKTWLAGGTCELLKDIEIGHMFRDKAPYVTQMHHMYFNKIWICWTILPEELVWKLLQRFPNHTTKHHAQRAIAEQWDCIQETKAYYQQIFQRTVPEVFERLEVVPLWDQVTYSA